MSGSAPWLVGALVTVFVAVVGPAGYLVTRLSRRTATADQKITETGQALAAFKDLVQDLQEERDGLKAEKADWRVERITMIHDMADLRRENAALKKAKRKGTA